eukprot:TRINITY_DN73946_c0_g1_i1.p1 TRINITY_DN73946_c0_g1~~TRINITY_DN73946_c0_g1_i1.p1  ORF type:complete len:815 (-),score=58.96 TRINITY_DN73946_c0_g1_i1:156-2366(-)
MAADNNLEAASIKDVQEILANSDIRDSVASGKYKLKLMIDRSNKTRSPYTNESMPGIGYIPETVYAEIAPKHSELKLLQTLGEANMDDGRSLESFLNQSLAHSKCDYTFLELWDHGAGFYGFGGDASSGKKQMKLAMMKDAMHQGSLQLPQQTYTMIGFDACLMSAYEVLSFTASMSKYVLAAETTEPGHGWDYSKFRPSSQGPEEMGSEIINDFVAFSNQAPRTLALIHSERFNSFKRFLDQELDRLSASIMKGNQQVLASAIRARSLSYEFKTVTGLTDAVDLGSFLHNMALQGHEFFGALQWMYDSMFVSRAASLSDYTGMGAFFPHPDVENALKKYECLAFRTDGLPLDSYRRFVWAVVSRGKGTPPPGEVYSCYESISRLQEIEFERGPARGNDQRKFIIPSFVEPPREETLAALSQSLPEELSSRHLILWLLKPTIDVSGQFRLFGLHSGATTDMKLIYGSRASEDALIVFGTIRPRFALPRNMLSADGFLGEAPWNTCDINSGFTAECGGIFADWLGPMELVQELTDIEGRVVRRSSLVTVQEQRIDSYVKKDSPELVSIPVRYYHRSGCSLKDGEHSYPGILQGLLSPPQGLENKVMRLEGWTLIVDRINASSIELDMVSARRGLGGGSFRTSSLVFNLTLTNDRDYVMSDVIPYQDASSSSPCFEYSCERGLAFNPIDCQNGTRDDPTLSLKVYTVPIIPMVTVLRARDVFGDVASHASLVEPMRFP